MILLTVGTEKFSFHRLVQAFDELCAAGEAGPLGGAECFAQIGSSSIEPQHVPFERLVPFPRMRALTEGADLVVTHAGAGSTLLALRSGKRPLVVPRLQRHGEHVDDHQLQLARRLAGEGLIHLVEDVAELGPAIAAALADSSATAVGGASELVGNLEQLVGRLERGEGLAR